MKNSKRTLLATIAFVLFSLLWLYKPTETHSHSKAAKQDQSLIPIVTIISGLVALYGVTPLARKRKITKN